MDLAVKALHASDGTYQENSESKQESKRERELKEGGISQKCKHTYKKIIES